jgi:hypothetical protein
MAPGRPLTRPDLTLVAESDTAFLIREQQFA